MRDTGINLQRRKRDKVLFFPVELLARSRVSALAMSIGRVLRPI